MPNLLFYKNSGVIIRTAQHLALILCLLTMALVARAQTHGSVAATGVTTATQRLEEFGVRHEPELGTPSCTKQDSDNKKPHCTKGPWLSTRSPNFVNIQKTAYLRGTFDVTNGIQLNSSFVAQHAATEVAIMFSAESYVRDDSAGAHRRMFVRALIDGKPAAPSDVVFATGGAATTRSFIFTTTVDAGIHTVEIQWLVDRDATAFMRDATLLVRTGIPQPPSDGTLHVKTVPGGAGQSTTVAAWIDVPGLGATAYVPANGVLTMSLSAESFVTGDNSKRMFVRALVDGVPALPSDVVFARGSLPQSRAITFGKTGLAPGWHQVKFQWQVDPGVTAHVGDRSIALAAYPSTLVAPSHPYVAAASGKSLMTISQNFEPLFDLETTIQVPAKGNGEVAVIFSGEAESSFNSRLEIVFAVDDVIDPQSTVTLADGQELAQAKTFTFAAKQLAPGLHKLGIYWRVQGAGTATLGDRSIAVMSEVGSIPDLAEALRFAPARLNVGDNSVGLEPVVGTRNVLTILWDPHRPDHGEPNEPDQTDIPVAAVQSVLFGANNSTNDYFQKASGGRFKLTNAGVLGWFNNGSVIWEKVGEKLPFCIDGYRNRHIAKRADALKQAEKSFNFAQYDRNRDGVLSSSELVIVLIIPQKVGFGKARVQVNDAECDVPKLTLDGVAIPDIVEWYTNAQTSDFIVAAHELGHQILGLDDVYSTPKVIGAGGMSLMSLTVDGAPSEISSHVDPLHKLPLGWITPKIIDHDGDYAIEDVKLGGKVFILPRYRTDPVLPWFGSRGEEYFIVENRQENLLGLYDAGIADSGIGVWHVVSDPKDNAAKPRGLKAADWVAMDQTQARRGMRLLKRFASYSAATGVATILANDTLWDAFGSNLSSGLCNSAFPDNFASWADCSASGYSLRFLTAPGNTMTVNISVP